MSTVSIPQYFSSILEIPYLPGIRTLIDPKRINHLSSAQQDSWSCTEKPSWTSFVFNFLLTHTSDIPKHDYYLILSSCCTFRLSNYGKGVKCCRWWKVIWVFVLCNIECWHYDPRINFLNPCHQAALLRSKPSVWTHGSKNKSWKTASIVQLWEEKNMYAKIKEDNMGQLVERCGCSSLGLPAESGKDTIMCRCQTAA